MKNKVIWLVPVSMLLLSFLPWPYGYYRLLRIVVTGCAGYLTINEYSHTKSITPFVVILAFITVLFNPVIPIYFSREIWAIWDALVALALGIHAVLTHVRINNLFNTRGA
ncbi:DUF6804 family protein [Legionella fairfieldensis]|uniref:DUF6804 family protein n=1 Tax=Legionella fairfieldensis TaxID=45064 RepID=UPI0006860497|nr:DUF6804 family protein [Legionella fairfieldensis]